MNRSAIIMPETVDALRELIQHARLLEYVKDGAITVEQLRLITAFYVDYGDDRRRPDASAMKDSTRGRDVPPGEGGTGWSAPKFSRPIDFQNVEGGGGVGVGTAFIWGMDLAAGDDDEGTDHDDK
jgi:hypothetical protein